MISHRNNPEQSEPVDKIREEKNQRELNWHERLFKKRIDQLSGIN
jgi:hypothetical protein